MPVSSRRNAIVGFCLWAMAALVSAPSNAIAAAPCENPESLRFALVPAQNSARELAYYKPILDLLAANTGKPVDLFVPSSYSALVEALLARRVDVAVLGPESYVLAHGKNPEIQVFGTYWRKGDGLQKAGPGYQSILITKKGSPFTTIDSLKNATLALVDPASTSGGMIPAKVFPKERRLLPLQEYFQRVTYSGGHDLSATAVAEGRVDAAFVASYRLMEAVNSGRIAPDQFNVLWASPQIPQDPFVTRASLCEGVRKVITETFLNADRTEGGRAFLDNVRSERIVPMTDSDYDIIRSVGR